MTHAVSTDRRLVARAVTMVAVLNLAYFAVEFSVALRIGSVSLFADSVDFLEDTAVNLLVLLALGWSVASRARLGMVLAALLLIPGIATVWTAWQQWHTADVPAALPMSATGLGALVVNVSCALLLVRLRDTEGSLTRAAFLSARNDAAANVAIVVAGLVSFGWRSHWPDLIVGAGIFAMNLDAAREVLEAARKEQRELKEQCSA
jgi:Co/Zn/Cd efflux system component